MNHNHTDPSSHPWDLSILIDQEVVGLQIAVCDAVLAWRMGRPEVCMAYLTPIITH